MGDPDNAAPAGTVIGAGSVDINTFMPQRLTQVRPGRNLVSAHPLYGNDGCVLFEVFAIAHDFMVIA
jgi:hypothetical protein